MQIEMSHELFSPGSFNIMYAWKGFEKNIYVLALKYGPYWDTLYYSAQMVYKIGSLLWSGLTLIYTCSRMFFTGIKYDKL